MKITENQIKILEFVKKNPNATPEAISDATGIFKLNVHKVAKQLVESGHLQMEEGEGGKTFSATGIALEEEPLSTEQPEEETSGKQEENEEEAGESKPIEVIPAKEVKKAGGKDISKFEFGGGLYGKGPLVRAVIAKLVEQVNPTFKELHKMFPDEIVRPYGVIKPVAEAKIMSEKKKRFFIADDQVIRLKDNKVVAVTNQMTSERMMAILEIARKNGIEI
jgi:hypothetical protein